MRWSCSGKWRHAEQCWCFACAKLVQPQCSQKRILRQGLGRILYHLCLSWPAGGGGRSYSTCRLLENCMRKMGMLKLLWNLTPRTPSLRDLCLSKSGYRSRERKVSSQSQIFLGVARELYCTSPTHKNQGRKAPRRPPEAPRRHPKAPRLPLEAFRRLP